MSIDTTNITPEESANMIVLHMEHMGYLAPKKNGSS
jgi:hypothetical protein